MYHQYENQKGNHMNEPPQVITTKDLLYLEDALSWELLASKKAYHFAAESQDPQIRQHLEHLASIHQRHYQILVNHLHSNTQQQNMNQYQYTNQFSS
ncbi:MAG: hypothetical protein WBI59_08185 [Limnochordia bacterium]